MTDPSVELSVVIISFNTRQLLDECLQSLIKESQGISLEIIIVDNASRDGSADYVEAHYPSVRLVRSTFNLGFAAANNLAFKIAQGIYIALLNSDAFLQEGALRKALERIKASPSVGLAGGRLIGRDGRWQPSARLFPSLLIEFLQLSGLEGKYASSRFFGQFNRTWASPEESCATDWVPAAFAIIPKHILNELGGFDERFFLYYEEVDLCRRIKAAGYQIQYWGDVVVIHIGGESSKTVENHTFSSKDAQLVLWRMRSELLYYRKHHGWLGAYAVKSLEIGWHRMRAWKNWRQRDKAEESRTIMRLMKQAWKETQGGRVSPSRPWG